MKQILKFVIAACIIAGITFACTRAITVTGEGVDDTTVITSVVQTTSDDASAMPSTEDFAVIGVSGTITKDSTLEEVTLIHVVDGDTLTVLADDGMEYKVRLIGIDTPESVHSDASRNNEFGKTASDHTKDILKDIDTLYLEYDVDTTDKYNRTLAYVWLVNDKSDISNMLNARILIDGYAVDKVYEPNHLYAETFAKLCQKANDTHAGLWQEEGYRALVNK